MKEIRCRHCNKKLAEADYRCLVIKCPRCGAMKILKAVEPPTRATAPGTKETRHVRPDP